MFVMKLMSTLLLLHLALFQVFTRANIWESPPDGYNFYKEQTTCKDWHEGCMAVKERALEKLFPGMFHTNGEIEELLQQYSSENLPLEDIGRKKRFATPVDTHNECFNGIKVESTHCNTCLYNYQEVDVLNMNGQTRYIVNWNNNYQFIPVGHCGDYGSCSNCQLSRVLLNALVTDTPPGVAGWRNKAFYVWFEPIEMEVICKCVTA